MSISTTTKSERAAGSKCHIYVPSYLVPGRTLYLVARYNSSTVSESVGGWTESGFDFSPGLSINACEDGRRHKTKAKIPQRHTVKKTTSKV